MIEATIRGKITHEEARKLLSEMFGVDESVIERFGQGPRGRPLYYDVVDQGGEFDSRIEVALHDRDEPTELDFAKALAAKLNLDVVAVDDDLVGYDDVYLVRPDGTVTVVEMDDDGVITPKK